MLQYTLLLYVIDIISGDFMTGQDEKPWEHQITVTVESGEEAHVSPPEEEATTTTQPITTAAAVQDLGRFLQEGRVITLPEGITVRGPHCKGKNTRTAGPARRHVRSLLAQCASEAVHHY